MNTSIEFCGGTHLRDIGRKIRWNFIFTLLGHARRLIITSEEAISKGIRRIVAVTGNEAEKAEKLAAKYQAQLDALGVEVKEAIAASSVTEVTNKVNEMLKVIEVAPISGSVLT